MVPPATDEVALTCGQCAQAPVCKPQVAETAYRCPWCGIRFLSPKLVSGAGSELLGPVPETCPLPVEKGKCPKCVNLLLTGFGGAAPPESF